MQAKAYAQSGEGGLWPEQYSMLLEWVADPAMRSMAARFFMAILHPQPSQRTTAAEALELLFVAELLRSHTLATQAAFSLIA